MTLCDRDRFAIGRPFLQSRTKIVCTFQENLMFFSFLSNITPQNRLGRREGIRIYWDNLKIAKTANCANYHHPDTALRGFGDDKIWDQITRHCLSQVRQRWQVEQGCKCSFSLHLLVLLQNKKVDIICRF